MSFPVSRYVITSNDFSVCLVLPLVNGKSSITEACRGTVSLLLLLIIASPIVRACVSAHLAAWGIIASGCAGAGAWEAALTNTLSPGDRVLMYETGHFAALWYNLAQSLGIEPEPIESDWRHGVDPAVIEARLAEDSGHAIKAVAVVHNETSAGVTSNVAKVREAIDNANHPALLLVDTISSLASIRYEHDAWGADVTVAGSQKA